MKTQLILLTLSSMLTIVSTFYFGRSLSDSFQDIADKLEEAKRKISCNHDRHCKKEQCCVISSFAARRFRGICQPLGRAEFRREGKIIPASECEVGDYLGRGSRKVRESRSRDMFGNSSFFNRGRPNFRPRRVQVRNRIHRQMCPCEAELVCKPQRGKKGEKEAFCYVKPPRPVQRPRRRHN